MAIVEEFQRFEANLVSCLRAGFGDIRRAVKRRSEFRATFKELSKLTDHELVDLGIARSDIARIARDSAK